MPVVYIYMSSECEACKLFRSFSLGAWHWLDSYGYACSKHIGGQLPHLTSFTHCLVQGHPITQAQLLSTRVNKVHSIFGNISCAA